VCCSVLQCVAVYCSELQRVVVSCSEFQCVAEIRVFCHAFSALGAVIAASVSVEA